MSAALLALLLWTPDDLTVLTRDGKTRSGKVVQEGAVTRIDTPLGPERVPASEVVAVFRAPAEAAAQAEEKFRVAKAAYAAAEALDVANPARQDKLHLAIEQAQAASAVYRALEPRYGSDASLHLARHIQVVQQFIRLCRGTSTSELAGPATARGPLIPLIPTEFKGPEAAEESARPWVLSTPLAPGLGERAKDLENPDLARRLDAVKALLHPPAPEQLPALLKLLEAETDPGVIQALGEGLRPLDPGPLLRSLGWARKAASVPKQEIVIALARAAGDRAAFDFVAAWFLENPPDKPAQRAVFGDAFRQFQAWSVPWLKESLTKQRQPRQQTEILRQMGVLGDKAFGVLLVKALPAYPRDASVALQKVGKPAVPFLMEGARSGDPDLKQPSLALLRRLTGVNGINLTHFEKWWEENRKAVIEAESAGRSEPVTAADFAAFEGR